MTRFEAEGITSPVVSVNCDYKKPTTYSDEIEITVWVSGYNGVKLLLAYRMVNKKTGDLVAVASSAHCFVDANGRPVSVKKKYPDFDAILKREVDLLSQEDTKK